MTAFYAVLDPQTRTLTYARAGHNAPRLATGGRVESLEAAGSIPLGIAEGRTFDQATTILQPGDLLLLYTDGVTEARPQGGEMFGEDGLRAVLGRTAGRPLQEVCQAVTDAVDAFQPEGQRDDVTLLLLRRQQ